MDTRGVDTFAGLGEGFGVHSVGGHAHDAGAVCRIDPIAVDVELEAHGAGDLDFFDEPAGEHGLVRAVVFSVGVETEDDLQITALFVREILEQGREVAHQSVHGEPEKRASGRGEVRERAEVLGRGEGYEDAVVVLNLDDHDCVADAELRLLQRRQVGVQAFAQGHLVVVERAAAVHENQVDDLLPWSGQERGERSDESHLGSGLSEAEDSGLGSVGIHGTPLCSFSIFPLLLALI